MDRGDEAVVIDLVEAWKDCDKAYDVICYVKPDLYLREEESKAFGKAWVYKNWDWSGVDSQYEEMMQHEESPSYLVRYWDDEEWERWKEDPYGWVEEWRECAGDDQHGEDAVDATMEEYEEHAKEHKEWYDDRWYDGYLGDYVERLINELTGYPAVMVGDVFDYEEIERRNWLFFGCVMDKWFDKLDRMTDKMCKDIYENNMNLDKTPMKGNLYKNKKTKALGLVLDADDVDESKWWKGSVRMLVEGEVKKISMRKSWIHEEKWVKVV